MGERGRVFVPFVEGMRGLAALFVVFVHIRDRLIYNHPVPGPPAPFLFWTHWLDYGAVGVDVFIVISGFCLMLPVLDSPELLLSGGFRGFVKRRFRRIVPPYYAALLISILLYSAALVLRGEALQKKSIALSSLYHVLLVHNLISRTETNAINKALWSVPLEFQIYLIFGLLLLPLARRFGLWRVVAGATMLSLVPHLFHGALDWTRPWFVGSFAMGMAAAAIGRHGRIRTRWLVAVSVVAFGAAAVLLARLPVNYSPGATIREDVLVAVSTAAFIAAATRKVRFGTHWAVVRFLQWKPVLTLGAFSYSIYLMHLPLVQLSTIAVDRYPFAQECLLYLFVVTPGIVAISYYFYRVAELPFISRFRRAEEPIAVSAAPAYP